MVGRCYMCYLFELEIEDGKLKMLSKMYKENFIVN
jgi:hypothetical protein